MDHNKQMEQFSIAYICAIVAVAGFNVGSWRVDEDSVDCSIAAGGTPGLPSRPQVDLQLKCTGTDIRGETELRYPLKRKNYDELRVTRLIVPRILVVVVVPPNTEDWLTQTEHELALRHCAYWLSLRGYPETTNAQSVTITVPRTQTFTPEGLVAMMTRIDDGNLP